MGQQGGQVCLGMAAMVTTALVRVLGSRRPIKEREVVEHAFMEQEVMVAPGAEGLSRHERAEPQAQMPPQNQQQHKGAGNPRPPPDPLGEPATAAVSCAPVHGPRVAEARDLNHAPGIRR